MPENKSLIRFAPVKDELVGPFETRVWAKIGRKKRQRKITAYALSCGVVLMAIWGVVEFQSAPKPSLAIGPGEIQKEEIPLMENLVFAAGDQQRQFPLEMRSPRKSSGGNRYSI